MQASDMQEKKNKRLVALLIVLLLATSGLYWFGNGASDTSIDKNIFQIDDYTSIDRITFESGKDKIELFFNGSRWRVNDSFDADRNLVSVLFATLKQAQPKRAVAASLLDSVNRILDTEGVHVSLFEGESLRKTFISGGDRDRMQSWFKHPVSNEIFLMTIPGYKVYVSGILQLSKNQWRDKAVFGFNWRNFRSLDVRYPAKPSDNFRVAPQNDVFGVEGIKTDTTKLGNYMDHVLSLAVNEYLEPGKYTDSLKTAQPVAIFTVTDIASKTYSLRIYDDKPGQVPALVQERDGAVFSRQKIQPVLRPKSYFSIK